MKVRYVLFTYLVDAGGSSSGSKKVIMFIFYFVLRSKRNYSNFGLEQEIKNNMALRKQRNKKQDHYDSIYDPEAIIESLLSDGDDSREIGIFFFILYYSCR